MTPDTAAEQSSQGRPIVSDRVGFFAALLVLLLAGFLRLNQLASVPPGFSEDEIINIRLVDNVRQGDIFVFYPDVAGGREGAWHVFVAFVTLFTGEGTIGFRILSLWLSMLSIAIVYTFGRRLFGGIPGLLAAALMAVNLSGIILARSMISDSAVVFLVSATMLALARSLPVYRRSRVITSNVISFAALGALLGIGLYLHPSSLFIALACVVYIAYLLLLRSAMPRQRWGYIGFALLLMIIIAMPYVISTINVPEYAALGRVLSVGADGPLRALVDGLAGIVGYGDADPTRNVPGRPLVDVFAGIFALVGVAVCFYRRGRPRFMLLLIMGLVCLPPALIVHDSPNFARMAVIAPQLAIFFGIGVFALLRLPMFGDVVFRRLAITGVLALLGVNIVWTWQDLFVAWQSVEIDPSLANRGLGQIAHYLDTSGDAIDTVLCDSRWRGADLETSLTDSDKTRLMMHRGDLRWREADCARGLLLTDGGALQRIVFFRDDVRVGVHPYLQEWLSVGDAVPGALPRGAVVELEVSDLLADRAGQFITMAPVWYDPEVAGEAVPVPPPIRFGSNLTFLGYEPNVARSYLPGESVDVITYWRAEGDLPPDLVLFTHILSDPVTLIAGRDVISVNPALLGDRDVFIQVTSAQLPQTALPGEKFVSVGAYRQMADERLPTLRDEAAFGERIFLYAIQVESPPAEQGNGA